MTRFHVFATDSSVSTASVRSSNYTSTLNRLGRHTEAKWPAESPTVQGETVEVTLDPIAINGAGVAIPDVLATNGVVHVIDAVLTPPEGL